jgi:sugar/nucleoside kinase (ribokinase family)
VRKYAAVGAGRAYTDVIAEVPPKLLDDFCVPLNGGRRCHEAVLRQIQARLPVPQWLPGGPAANTMAGIAALGLKAGFFGKVMRDLPGEAFLADFRFRGVDLCCPPYGRNGPLSATCLVLLTPDGSRSFAFHPGCADEFTPADFAGFDFSQAEHFLVEAHALMDSPARAVLNAAITAAHRHGCRVAVNLQGMESWDGIESVVRDIIAGRADIIVGNETEQEAFSAIVPWKRLQADQIAVMTRGPDGAVAQCGADYIRAGAEAPARFVSSVGAGDQFIAGLLAGLALGRDLKASLTLAAQTAGAVLEEQGVRPTRSLAHLLRSG